MAWIWTQDLPGWFGLEPLAFILKLTKKKKQVNDLFSL